MVHCGASAVTKRWPEDRFREVVARVRSRDGCAVVVVPDPDGYGSSLSDQADAVLTGLSLVDLVSATAAVDAFIGNDSGPAHIAAALGVPTVSIFGPSDPRRFAPLGSHARVIHRNICKYMPCWDSCRYDHPICLKALDVDEVFSFVEEHLGASLRLG
jgi:ADP-heptose:LPS heptosyltransferase